jgi:hypothetical protein
MGSPMFEIGRKLTTDMKFRVASVLIAIAVPVSLITGKLGWATATMGAFVIALSLCKHRYESSINSSLD